MAYHKITKMKAIDENICNAAKNAVQYFKMKTEGGPAPDLKLFEFAYQKGAQAVRNTEVVKDALYLVMLTDFTRFTFNHCRHLIIDAASNLQGMTFRGAIGHPGSECTDDEYLTMPIGGHEAFTVFDVIVKDNSECWGVVQFADSPIGKAACTIYAKGGRYSVRSVERESSVEIITWDLVE